MATSNAATNYLEHAILDFLFKNNSESFATPGNSIYVGLATAVSSIETGSLTEATFGSYARQQVQASGWTVPAVGTDAQTATNAANIEFPASTGTNNTITHAFVVDAASSGNILFVGALDASKTIATGDIFRINAGNLSIELK
jgi:F0F1-type ATP synthase membrane subunit c/vacuolar-type H+-ATPase subunit K